MNCLEFEPAVKIPLDSLGCAFALTVCSLRGHPRLSVGVWPGGRPGEPAPQYNPQFIWWGHLMQNWCGPQGHGEFIASMLGSAVRCSALPGLPDNTVSSSLDNMVAEFDTIELQSGPLLWPLHLSGLTIEAGIWITSEGKLDVLWCVWLAAKRLMIDFHYDFIPIKNNDPVLR